MSTPRPYHQFMGNGIDAMLIGPSGAMCPEQAQGLDRCYWYKSDLYYPDSRQFVSGQDPCAFINAPPGGTNFQLAPLARTWYELLDAAGSPLPLTASEQHFDTTSGVLQSIVHYGGVRVELRTALAGDSPALLFELQASKDFLVRAYVEAGLWPEDTEQADPLSAVSAMPDLATGLTYNVGNETCTLCVLPDDENSGPVALWGSGRTNKGAWILLRGTHIRWRAVLESTRYQQECGTYTRLAAEPEPPASAAMPAIEIPDPDFARLHAFSMYMFRAIQHRYSGGIPVNNLRRTFNSHVFWDGAFVQRALLEAGHVEPAREAWRFLARTQEAAAANARDTFNASGLHWDWETTHRGERAYVPWMQQRFQVHNTPLLAHMILADFRATRDRAALAEGYDLLAGAATFILDAVLVERDGVVETRPLVGSHEAATPVVNDGATVAACLRLLRDVALAARVLGRQDELSRRCRTAAARLRPSLAGLFNGRYFQASRDEDRLNTSSLTPIYPADVVVPTDPRAVTTAQAYRARYAGRMAGHGNNEAGFPWSAGILARILAYQGQSEAAWEQLDFARVALCAQGGCAEYVDPEGHWNLQYFSTAQAALCSALHALLLQQHGAELHFFPAVPQAWGHCSFTGFLVAGLRVDAAYERGRASIVVHNETDRTRSAVLRLGSDVRRLTLTPGAKQSLELENSNVPRRQR
ncbi:MAG: hypothetical protein JWO42_4183 [Chloroflexi bacterium]|jgi:hypothetical protein|nr:hypothetical protein [Chloroflexota bacterium]